MDGNGRWAKKRNKKRTFGHREGAENVRRIVKHSARRGIKHLTLFTFSTENWNRPKREVNTLMRMFSSLLDKEVSELNKNNVRIDFIGRRDRLGGTLLKKMENAEKETEENTGLNLVLAIDYGGRREIVDACSRIMRQSVSSIDEDRFRDYLYKPSLPDVDLLIRTADEMRISNFLLWQGAYAEIYVSPLLWPDFDEDAMDNAIEEYQTRERKFGEIKE